MYILAGFSDKLRLMNLLIDDIKTFREFNVRNCTACAFSCGGHLLAAVDGASTNVVSIFSSVNFRNTVIKCYRANEPPRYMRIANFKCAEDFYYGYTMIIVIDNELIKTIEMAAISLYSAELW